MFFSIGYNDLPSSLGVFPLSDVILLPRMQLSLNVFEPRYLSLVEDSLRRDSLLAIVQPREDSGNSTTDSELFSIGGVARLTAFQEDEDRLLISLEGVCRVRFGSELPCDRGYRIFSASYDEFAGDFSDDSHRASFLRRDVMMPLLSRYLSFLGIDLSVEALSPMSDERLVYSIAMLANFDCVEKQALLECMDIEKQADMLMALMVMAMEGSSGSGHDII